MKDLKNAFLDNSESIDQSFGDVSFTITDALTTIRNRWGFWLADMNETYKITETIGTMMVKAFDWGMDVLQRVQTRVEWLVDKLGGFENVLRLIGIVGASVFGAMMLPKILAFISAVKSMASSFSLAKLKILAVVAIIALLFLIVDDFLAFMRGEDSVIGSLFEKMGIDADKAREWIINAWTAIQRFLLSSWETIKSAAQDILSALSTWWSENGESIKASLRKLWEAILNLCVTLWNALKKCAILIFEALKAFWETWGSTIITIFTTLWNTLIALITPFLDALVAIITFLVSVFTGDWQGAWEAILAFTQALWEMICTLIQGAWEIICALGETGFALMKETFENMHKAITEKVSDIKNSIVDGFQAAIIWITALPSQALTWGKDIILGIVDGIMGSVSKVTDACKSVASNIKSFLGFSVPEAGPLSNFDTYMPDMIDLMVEGIEGTKSKVLDSVKGMATEMSDEINDDEDNKKPNPFGGFFSGVMEYKEEILAFVDKMKQVSEATLGAVRPDTLQKTSGDTHSSSHVNQTVNITNEFHGDQAGQKKSAEAMDKASDDATGQLARALRYT